MALRAPSALEVRAALRGRCVVPLYVIPDHALGVEMWGDRGDRFLGPLEPRLGDPGGVPLIVERHDLASSRV